MATFTDKQKQEIESARLRVSSGKGTPTDRKNISYFDKNTPKGVAQEKPAGDISGTLPKAPTVDDIFNFKTSLGEALNEATQVRKQQQVSALGPYMEGLPNSAIGTALGAIRQGANVSAESLFKFGVEAQRDVFDMETERKKMQFDNFKLLAESGAILGMDNSSLLELEKAASMPAGTALAWKAQLEIAKKHSDEEFALKKQQIQMDIANTRSLIANRGGYGGGGGISGIGELSVPVKKSFDQYLKDEESKVGQTFAPGKREALRKQYDAQNIEPLDRVNKLEAAKDTARIIFSQLPKTKAGNFSNSFKEIYTTGDINKIKQFLNSQIISLIPADQRNRVIGRNGGLLALDKIERDLDAFQKAGGNTNIFTGTREGIMNRIGTLTSQEQSRIANEIALSIIAYRQSMTGAQFSEAEAAQYNSVFPNTGNIPALNKAKIQSLRDSFNINQKGSLSAIIGSDTYDALYGKQEEQETKIVNGVVYIKTQGGWKKQ